MTKLLNKYLKVSFLVIFLFLCQFKIYATGELGFIYKTKNVFASFYCAIGWGGDTDEEKKEANSFYSNFHVNIKRSVKHLFELERFAKNNHQKIELYYYHNKILNEIELKNELMKLAKIKDHSSFKNANYFKGYTLQIGFVQKGMNFLEEKIFWQNKFDPIISKLTDDEHSSRENLFSNSWLGIIYLEESEGCPFCLIFPRIWTYSYKNGEQGIRFGLFFTVDDALEAAKKLKLDKNHLQIYPIKLSTDAFYELVMKNPF